jgi:cytochrome c-type biogenesis protein
MLLAALVPAASPLFWPLAFGAGILSFASPCVLPLLPGYVCYVTGLSGEEMREEPGRLMLGCALFVAGFAIIFTAEGATASLLGSLVQAHRQLLFELSGVFIVVMGLFMLGLIRIPVLYSERRWHATHTLGLVGALPLGMAFAFGWTPCIGPVLAAIDTVAGTQGSVRMGAALLFVYALGLGVPFLVAGWLLSRGVSAVDWLRRHTAILNAVGGVVLCAMGILLITNRWVTFLGPAMRFSARLNWPPI